LRRRRARLGGGSLQEAKVFPQAFHPLLQRWELLIESWRFQRSWHYVRRFLILRPPLQPLYFEAQVSQTSLFLLRVSIVHASRTGHGIAAMLIRAGLQTEPKPPCVREMLRSITDELVRGALCIHVFVVFRLWLYVLLPVGVSGA
jgi:hypothetical protein